MKKEKAIELLNIYGQAWVNRDPNLIITIFTPDATYHDPKEPKNHGHDGIREYWIKKVIGEQKDISFQLKNVWIDNDVIIAEWDAKFTDIKRNLLIDMQEIAIFTVKDDKFNSLREYYKTQKTPYARN